MDYKTILSTLNPLNLLHLEDSRIINFIVKSVTQINH